MQEPGESGLEPGGYQIYQQEAGSMVQAEEGYEAYEGYEGEEYYQEGGLAGDTRVGDVL